MGKTGISKNQKDSDQIACSMESLTSIDSNPEGVLSSSNRSSKTDLTCNMEPNDRPPCKKRCALKAPETNVVSTITTPESQTARRNSSNQQEAMAALPQPSQELMEAQSRNTAQSNMTPNSRHSAMTLINKNRFSAQADLSSPSIIQNLPPSTRKVHIRCLNENISLVKLNPLKLARSIDAICGPVQGVQHLRSGGLFISCHTLDQVNTLLTVKHLPIAQDCQIHVQVTIALSSRTTLGKIYAPELY